MNQMGVVMTIRMDCASQGLLGFGAGARTATAKVGKDVVPLKPVRLVGFETGERTAQAKVGKNEASPPR